MPNHYLQLPENYREVFHVDAKNKKTGLILNGIGLVLTALLVIPPVLLADYSALHLEKLLLYDIVFLAALVAYLVLHELAHGAAYKLLTKEKLTFGFSWSCAYCGVPQCYTSRKTALFSLFAPLTVFTLVFLPLAIGTYFVNTESFLLFSFLFAVHIGGCTGDLYMIFLLCFRYKDPALLMRDTGPEQWLYLPADPSQTD